MSHLQLNQAKIPNMSKGIISLWFKGARSKAADAPAKPWPIKAPPDRTKELEFDPPDTQAFMFYDPYGEKGFVDILPIRGTPPLIYPFPPVVHRLATEGTLPQDKFNFILTFGDPAQPYDYRPWDFKKISTMDGVLELGSQVIFNYKDWPPPYRPHFKVWPIGPNKGKPLGADGKLPVYNIQLADEAEPRTDLIPQSFIGITEQGELRILLQTNTKAAYNGYMYIMDKAETLWARSSMLVGPLPSPDNLFPERYWTHTPPYWAGYQFIYRDTSIELMNAWPEFFMINGPAVVGEGWNHLLFSFDISGEVSLTMSESPGLFATPTPTCSTNCKAWLAINDVNYTGVQLQSHPITLAFDPAAPSDAGGLPQRVWTRQQLGLGLNDIVPQSVFLRGPFGNPKDTLPTAYAAATSKYVKQLDPNQYRALDFALSPPGIVDPVTAPDPKSFPTPSYKCETFSIPTFDHPIGVPAGDVHADHVRGVYMGEMQIWEGQTLDTGVLANRRLFVDSEGKPTSMEEAERILGRPDIILHGTEDWQEGRNTGSIGVQIDADGNEIELPGGQFDPTGSIIKYEPDPQLGK